MQVSSEKMPPQNLGRTWVEIDSAALIGNVILAREAAEQAAVMAVVRPMPTGTDLPG